MAVDLSKEETLRFLDLYRKQECLWKPEYKREKKSRDAAMSAMASQMGTKNLTAQGIRTTINSMRAKYAVELKKVMKAEAFYENYKPSAPWFYKMDSFLRDVITDGMPEDRRKELITADSIFCDFEKEGQVNTKKDKKCGHDMSYESRKPVDRIYIYEAHDKKRRITIFPASSHEVIDLCEEDVTEEDPVLTKRTCRKHKNHRVKLCGDSSFTPSKPCKYVMYSSLDGFITRTGRSVSRPTRYNV